MWECHLPDTVPAAYARRVPWGGWHDLEDTSHAVLSVAFPIFMARHGRVFGRVERSYLGTSPVNVEPCLCVGGGKLEEARAGPGGGPRCTFCSTCCNFWCVPAGKTPLFGSTRRPPCWPRTPPGPPFTRRQTTMALQAARGAERGVAQVTLHARVVSRARAPRAKSLKAQRCVADALCSVKSSPRRRQQAAASASPQSLTHNVIRDRARDRARG